LYLHNQSIPYPVTTIIVRLFSHILRLSLQYLSNGHHQERQTGS
jgi:hypothetical protein